MSAPFRLANPHPWGLTDTEAAEHRRFLDWEHDLAAAFADALAVEPELTCREWERRNPFLPTVAA